MNGKHKIIRSIHSPTKSMRQHFLPFSLTMSSGYVLTSRAVVTSAGVVHTYCHSCDGVFGNSLREQSSGGNRLDSSISRQSFVSRID
jgi:hypothetical protein